MSGIIETIYRNSATLYAHIRDNAGAVWNGSAFETYNSANWGNYDIAMTEDAGSAYYKVAWPGSISAGKYMVYIYEQLGGSPATGDQPAGTGVYYWNGSSMDSQLNSAIADSVWDEDASGHMATGTYGQYLQVVRAATAQAGAAGTITLDASASSVNDFYKNQVIFVVGGTGAGQSKIISAYVGSTKVATVNDNWATNPNSSSVFIITPFGSVPGASAPTSAQVADAVWDEARSGHVAAGSFGEGVLVESLNTTAKANVNTEADTALADIRLDELVNVSASPSNGAIGSIVDKMMNKNAGQTFDQSTDSLEAIKDLGSGPSAGQIADAVWDEGLSTSDHASINSAGERLRAIDDKLPTGTISDFDESSNNVNLNSSQSGVTIGTVNSLGSSAVNQVNAEVVDVIRTDSISELSSGTPSSTPSLSQALMLLYMALRNKSTETSSEFKIFNNSGTAIAKATVSDNSVTFTREQLGAP